MATIGGSRKVMTLINTFEVEPEAADALVDKLIDATRTVMDDQPGFVSASIHKSEDGSRVVNYAQWATKEDFDTMTRNPQAQAHMKECAALAKSFDPRFYRVVESISR